MTSAIVFALTQHLITDADRCINYCLAHGYDMVGVVKDDWARAIEYLTTGVASVLVVASTDHIPPDATPRIEVVADAPPAHPGPAHERTRMVRRNAGGSAGRSAAVRR